MTSRVDSRQEREEREEEEVALPVRLVRDIAGVERWFDNKNLPVSVEQIAAALNSAPNRQEVTFPSVDDLAQIIRRVDGNHSLGAGALAEAIIAALSSPREGEKCVRCDGTGEIRHTEPIGFNDDGTARTIGVVDSCPACSATRAGGELTQCDGPDSYE